MKRIFFFIATSILIVTVTQAQVINLNNSVKATAKNTVPSEFLKEAKTARVFDINPALQRAQNVKIGDKVALQLFENQNYSAMVTKTATNVNGNFTVSLKLPDYPMALGYVTTDKEGKSLFFVSIPELNQKFVSRSSINSQTSFLIEIDESFDKNLQNDEREIPKAIAVNEDGNPVNELRSAQAECSRDASLTGTDPATIDLLIVYTPAAAAWATANEGGISNTIAGAMEQTRAVLANQGNDDVINMIHSEQIDYEEVQGDGMSTDLDRLTDISDGYMDIVHQLRKQYHADIVALFEFHDGSDGIGGLGWVLNDANNGSYSYAFNVIRAQQASSSTTSIHEIGHNMGMLHNAENNNISTSLYPYAYGWHWVGDDSGTYGSVMSYIGTRTPYFSNPDKSYRGAPTGVEDVANNAQVFRNTKHIVAFYSDKLSNLPDMPTNIVVSNPTANGATFSWDPCVNATSYRVCRPTGTGGYSYMTTTNTSYTTNNAGWFPQPCTTYEFFIAAVNDCGDAVNGPTISFSTACATDPTVVTLDATNVSNTSATLNKTVTANGETVISQGFKYKISSFATWLTSTDGNLTELTPSTQYQFYAYATTATNTFTGKVLTFTTSSCDITDQTIYTIEMQDAYGDGWNGGSLKIRQNDVEIKTVTLESSGSGQSNVSLCVCAPFELIWVKGQYDYECSFIIRDNNNTEIFATPAGSYSSNTTAGCALYTNGQIVYSGMPDCIKIWTPLASSTDWNDAANWDPQGIPSEKAKVIIPKSSSYPILTEPVTVAEIHFDDGAQILGQSQLTEETKAFVSYNLNTRDRWLMLSMPLGQAYASDFAFGGYPVTWVRTFKSEGDRNVANGSWATAQQSTKAFSFGDGFIVWLNKDDEPGYPINYEKGLSLLSGIRELPFFQHHAGGSPDSTFYSAIHQSHDYDGTEFTTFFNYTNEDGDYVRSWDQKYNVDRTDAAYRLAGANVTREINFGEGNFALFGNPFMAALDFDQLYQENASIKPFYYVWTGSGYETYSYVIGSAVGVMGAVPLDQYIAPLQGFLVEKPENPTSESLNFNESMATTDTDAGLRSSVNNENELDIVARNPAAGVRTVIAQREGGQDEFGDLDARKITNGISEVPEIYTLKPYKGGLIAVAVNIIDNDNLLIPMGLATSYAGDITLSFSGMDSYDVRLSLIDAETNREIDLTGLTSFDYAFNYAPQKTNGETAACEDRFFIRISKTVTGLNETAAEKVNVYASDGRIQIVSGTSNPINEVAVYDVQGALIYKANAGNALSHTIRLNRPAGAYIVKVISEKNVDTVKVIIR